MASDSILFVAWLRAEDWPRWLKVCPDLPATYEEWLANPHPVIKGADVTDIRKVEIRPDQFLAWGRASGASFDSVGRTQYAISLGEACAARISSA